MRGRTTPWHEAEFVRLGKYMLVYELRRGELRVKLPGGKTMAFAQLAAMGNAKHPKVVRSPQR